MRYELYDPALSEGRTAYVCGAREGSGNIGEAVADELFRSGWYVLADDCAMSDGSRPPGGNLPNDEVAREHGYIVTDKGRYQWFDAPSFDRFRDSNPDALVVTLGATYKDSFDELKPETLDRIMRANLLLPLECVRRFVAATEQDRRMFEGEGMAPGSEHDLKHIVLVGSYAHDHPFTNGTLYCAAKAGLDAAGRALGWELTDLGYRVHVVHPYHVQGTPMWAEVQGNMERTRGMTSEEADAYARKDLKMPDLLTPTEVAEVIRVLVTEPAMGWLSGQSLKLYGGTR